jgi:UDP-N-acetylglucosamine 2-epimerase (non-hydrolysing)
MLLTSVESASGNIESEGIDPARIHFVGNVMAESLLRNLDRIEGRVVPGPDGPIRGAFVLATIHRPENTDHPERLAEIGSALSRSPLPVVFPTHPRTRPLLVEAGLGGDCSSVTLMDPVGYLDMLALQRDASAIVTDSGGIQEEACLLGTPCVTVRRNTEREITVEVGANRLTSARSTEIGAALTQALGSACDWPVPARWDTDVSERVVAALQSGVRPLSGC